MTDLYRECNEAHCCSLDGPCPSDCRWIPAVPLVGLDGTIAPVITDYVCSRWVWVDESSITTDDAARLVEAVVAALTGEDT